MTTAVAQTSHLEGLAKAIAVPNLNRPHRLPTFPNLERTATLAFTDTSTVRTPSGGTLYGVLTRDPAYPLWLSTEFSAGSSFYKTGSYITPAAANGIVLPAGTANDLEFSADDVTTRSGIFGSNTGFSPVTGSSVPYLSRGGELFFPLGGNCNGTTLQVAIEMTMTAVATEYTGWVTLECLTASCEVVDKRLPITFTAGVTDAVPPAANPTKQYCYIDVGKDYIGVRFTAIQVVAKGSGVLQTLSYGVTTTNPAFIDSLPEKDRIAKQVPLSAPVPALPVITRLLPKGDPPEVYTTPLIWQSTRATAVALLLTNVTPVLEKEGTVSAARIPCGNARSGALPFQPSAWSGFATIHPRDRYFGALEKGLYTYTLPDVHSENFVDCLVSYDNLPSSDAQYPVANLDSFSYANCFELVDGDATRTTTMALTLDRHLEFRTTSRVFPTDFSKEALETYHAAQMALTRMGCFTENPVHLATIAGMATQAVRALWPIVKPYAVPAAQAVTTAAVNWAKNKIAGSLNQAGLAPQPNPPRQRRAVPAKRKARAQRKRR